MAHILKQMLSSCVLDMALHGSLCTPPVMSYILCLHTLPPPAPRHTRPRMKETRVKGRSVAAVVDERRAKCEPHDSSCAYPPPSSSASL